MLHLTFKGWNPSKVCSNPAHLFTLLTYTHIRTYVQIDGQLDRHNIQKYTYMYIHTHTGTYIHTHKGCWIRIYVLTVIHDQTGLQYFHPMGLNHLPVQIHNGLKSSNDDPENNQIIKI